MEINEFADMTDGEYNALFTFQPIGSFKDEYGLKNVANVRNLPTSVDWRKKGAVSELVRSTGGCGASWAFSATAAVEAQLYIKKGNLTLLSPQDLIDCANATFGNHGCYEGSAINAFNYIRRFGIVSEKQYGYEARQGACRQRGVGVRISGFTKIPSYDEQSLLIAAATIGPVSVAIDASSLKFYRSGIIDNYSGCRSEFRYLNFEAIIVAYDADSWTLKNCWGPYWGENGYFRLQRNTNTCGVALRAAYPVL
ncbi:unnamed protein product [Acanthoscelides obtectus]|nr:unnamed protein product [Acanthoscelides obtectus]CAK1636149.1 Cathepsin L [Acanthoscelides obtectus]